MTTRERLERKIARREGWAQTAAATAAARFAAVQRLADGIPLGQPILVGHHSERGARRDCARLRAGMDAGCEAQQRAADHAAKAAGLADQLDRAIFDDDLDAIAQLEARIAAREAEAAHMKSVNAAWMKAARSYPDPPARLVALIDNGTLSKDEALALAKRMAVVPWLQHRPYDATNTRASIRRDRERLQQIQRRRAHECATEAAGGATITENGFYATVRFLEKPDHAILQSLREAGFQWHGGAWHGRSDTIPADVRAFVAALQKEIDNGSESA